MSKEISKEDIEKWDGEHKHGKCCLCGAEYDDFGRRPTLACMMVSQDLADVFLTVEKELAA